MAGVIRSLGTLLGSVNILYAIVGARAREMATLRAIGYGALPVAASVVIEALLLALVGALLGAGIAWWLFDGQELMVAENVYTLLVSGRLAVLGVVLALVLALFGSLPPAVRAGRRQVIQALRAT